jgi:hypothetical protein
MGAENHHRTGFSMRVVVVLTVLALLLSLGACSRRKQVAYAEAYSAAPLAYSVGPIKATEYRMETSGGWSPQNIQPENEAVEQDAQARFEVARGKADRLGGVHLLTQEDIDGLSYEQIQRLRGY